MKPILSAQELRVHYPLEKNFWGKPKKVLKAVDGVSLDLFPGEILGLVGESGCGKSSLGKALLRLIPQVGGRLQVDAQDFLTLQGESLRHFRTKIQMVFQDPYASLDPRMTIFELLEEPLNAHFKLTKKEKEKKIHEILRRVNLNLTTLKKYPHEFSGGQRQRIAIARALILEPKILIADEPVSSLDVSVQAQILNLLKEIQKEFRLSLLFVSHNLAVVRYISDRIAVMYLGKIVEVGSQKDLFENPLHPYTKALLQSVPIPDPKKERERAPVELKGEIPSPIHPPSGCTFHTRCPNSKPRCETQTPVLEPKGNVSQKVSCFEVA